MSGGLEKRKSRERRARELRVGKNRWTKAVPAWRRLEDFQLSLDTMGVPIGTKALSLKERHSTCHLQ